MKSIRFTALTLAAATLLSFGGCASTPTTRYSKVKPLLPKISQGKGRVIFYRTSALGGLLHPDIMVNGKVVGEAYYGQYFYKDLKPGKYIVSVRTEAEYKENLTVKNGQEAFVRFGVKMGVFVGRVYPELPLRSEALEDLESLKYVGPNSKKYERKIASEAKK